MRVRHFFAQRENRLSEPGDLMESHAGQHMCDHLLTMDIFRGLLPQDFGIIGHAIEKRTCCQGQLIYSQEDPVEALFLLKRGRVRLYRLTPSGKRLELAVIEPGTFFGEMPLLGESMRNTYAEALEDSLICVMSRSDIERLVCAHPQVALRIIEVLGRRLALCEARLEEVAYRSVPARIAALLVRLSQEQLDEVVEITHQELGDMIGAIRETVTKTLDEFQQAGLVELCRGRIILRDVAGLQARMEE
jgi:CRP/FNR family cyclic AMP-dependent transcriptional regulator